MRRETNLYQGTTIVLERPADLADLSADDARAIPAAVRAMFVDFRTSFRALASAVEGKAFARWLRHVSKVGRCELAIDRPGNDLRGLVAPAEVHLRVGEERSEVLLSGPFPRVPARVPPPLAEVLRLVGVVRVQYGAAGGLIAPSEQRRLLELSKEIAKNWGMTAEEAAIPLPPEPKGHWTFFENACGSAMTANANGDTWHMPMAGGDYVAGPPIGAWLDGFFRPGFVWT